MEDQKELTKFIKLLKQLDTKQQEGVYLMIKGAAVLTGEKRSIFE